MYHHWISCWVTHHVASPLLHPCNLKRPTVGQTTKTYLGELSRNKMVSFSTPGCRGRKACASLPSPLNRVLLNPRMLQYRELQPRRLESLLLSLTRAGKQAFWTANYDLAGQQVPSSQSRSMGCAPFPLKWRHRWAFISLHKKDVVQYCIEMPSLSLQRKQKRSVKIYHVWIDLI